MARLGEYKRKRNFSKTSEPSGDDDPRGRHGKLQFVIQKHAASHLHYDFRLELDGVMKSWAVPKGPSVDPAVKRLAMEVEDHPMHYNSFEGTIPQGEYGGGTVMLWDRGTYFADEAVAGEDSAKVLKREYHAGKMSVTLQGERLRGSWALVRTDPGPKPKWLLIKHRDEHARKYEATEEFVTSVVTDRTMDEIAGGDRVWHSNRGAGAGKKQRAPRATKKSKDTPAILPTRPQSVRKLPADEERAYLPWRGGDRVLAYATADACALVDEEGRDTTNAFPDISAALAGLSRRVGSSFVLDAEIVSDDGADKLYAIDILFADSEPLVQRPWSDRRAELEGLFRKRRVQHASVAPTFKDSARLLRRAKKEEWRGVLAIDTSSKYSPGKRTRDWLVLAAG